MTWVDLLAGQPEGVRVYDGVIADDAATVQDEVAVVLPAFSDTHRFGPAPWPSRVTAGGAVDLPNRGDRCCVALAETPDPGQPEVWIIGWWPYA